MSIVEVRSTLSAWFLLYKEANLKAIQNDILRDFIKLCSVSRLDHIEEWEYLSGLYHSHH